MLLNFYIQWVLFYLMWIFFRILLIVFSNLIPNWLFYNLFLHLLNLNFFFFFFNNIFVILKNNRSIISCILRFSDVFFISFNWKVSLFVRTSTHTCIFTVSFTFYLMCHLFIITGLNTSEWHETSCYGWLNCFHFLYSIFLT